VSILVDREKASAVLALLPLAFQAKVEQQQQHEAWRPWLHQVPPSLPWRIWILRGGRGSGKTEAGARYVRAHLHEAGSRARVGVGAPTIADSRDVCAEGETGLITLFKDEFPVYGGDWQRRSFRFDRMTQDDTDAWIGRFWGPHAGHGGKFRYYPDKTDTVYLTMRLEGESLRSTSRGVRELGYALWSIAFDARRAPA